MAMKNQDSGFLSIETNMPPERSNIINGTAAVLVEGIWLGARGAMQG
jgi:hypothetical protein